MYWSVFYFHCECVCAYVCVCICVCVCVCLIKDGVYLMPALLRHLDSVQASKYVEQGTSLIIRPSQGCVASGLFCCLVAHLLSPSNHFSWKVCMNRDKPLRLYRNCITFELDH